MIYYSKDTACDLKVIVIILDNDLQLQLKDSLILEHFLILPIKKKKKKLEQDKNTNMNWKLLYL